MKKVILSAFVVAALSFTACNDDDDNNTSKSNLSNLSLDLTGLENLGDDYQYEGWVMVNGTPVSTGTFKVDDSGKLSKTSFSVASEELEAATKFVLSIEPTIDDDPAPAATKILAGDFSGDSASVNSDNVVVDATGTIKTLGASWGKYILATPTDGMDNNEYSGVWFLDNSSGSAVAGLGLPKLSAGWKYEGWAVIDGTPVSTGTFTDPGKADDNASTSTFKGDMGNGPAYPGEDYIQNAPEGLTFPTDLRGKTIVVSVEPSPDNSPKPFALKPLAHTVEADVEVHTTVTMGAGPVTMLSGTVTR